MIMKGKHLASSKSHVFKEQEEKTADQLRGQFMPGDLIWVRLGGSSWWPAQVVNEDAVSRSNKPGDRSEDEVLVRVYGSYNYLYVDPVKCHSEFENILKQNNGSYREIFHKSLKQDLPSSKSSRSKGRGSKSKVPGKDFSKKTIVWKFKANVDKEWKLLAVSSEEVESKTFKGNGDVKKLRLKGPSAKEEANCKTSKQNGVQKKSKPTDEETEREMEAKSKTVKNVRLQEQLVPNCPSARKEARGKTPKQDGVLKKRRQSSQCQEDAKSLSAEKEAKRETPKQDHMPKKLNSNTPCLATRSAGKTDVLDARRMRVMRNLGLTPPAGSPFDKNAHN